MSAIEEKITQFLEDNNITAAVNEVPVTLMHRQGGQNRCWEVRIERNGVHDWLYAFSGPMMTYSVEDALRSIQEDLLNTVGNDTFERWSKENDDGYYERTLGLEVAQSWYETELKSNELALRKVLGEDLFREFYELDRED